MPSAARLAARRSDRPGQELLAQGFGKRILAFDARAADLSGEIVTARQAVGRPIDAFDAMIAAIALAHGSALVTRNHADCASCGIALIDASAG